MKLILIVFAVCCSALVNSDAEFEEYKRTHPEEFSGQTEGDMVMLGRNAYTNIRKWTNGIVPYEMSTMSDSAKTKIRAALNDLQTRVGSCIQFKERTNERNYLTIRSYSGCYSYVGMRGGQQVLSLKEYGCLGAGTIQHEFIHALGFMHEQCRSDRDKYLTIHWENIPDAKKHNFNKLSSINQGLPYTYESVMHYGKYAFSNNGKPTMTPTKTDARIGIRKLHNRDVKMIQLFYGCNTGNGGNGGDGNGGDGNGGNEKCIDYSADCESWASRCNDGNWVKEQCPKTCGQCKGSGGTTTPVTTTSATTTVPIPTTVTPDGNCKDKEDGSLCTSCKGHGYCKSDHYYFNFMRENCKKTCGLC